MRKFVPKGMENINMPVILAVAGVITLIVFFIMLLPNKKGSTEEIRILEGRLARLEKQLADMEESNEQRFTDMETFHAQFGTVAQDAQRFMTMPADIDNIHSKLDNLDKRQGNLERKVSGSAAPYVPPRPAASARASVSDLSESDVPAGEVTAPAASASDSGTKPVKTIKALKKKPGAASARFHRVAKGENLYTIARHYNISVKDLIRMNRLPPDTTMIHIGQKLYIGK
ncbi:MAG: LysM peptidoglycan-binding domain-containing protein [Desulfobacterales bacterium]